MEVSKEIGKGAYGCVYTLAKNNCYALKKFDHNDREFVKSFFIEISSMSLLNHKNIMKCAGYKFNNNSLEFYMKRYPINLLQYLKKYSNKNIYIKTSLINKMLIDILSGIDYLHINGILHLDISDDNIMLDENLNCVITDFGLSDVIHKSSFYDNKDEKQKFPVFKNPFASPEVLNKNYYDSSSDIWAFGVLMAKMFNYKYIFEYIHERNDQDMHIKKYFEYNLEERKSYIKNWMMPREIDYEGLYAVDSDISSTHLNILLSIFIKEIDYRPSAKKIIKYLSFCEFSPNKYINNDIHNSELRYFLIDILNRKQFDIDNYKLVTKLVRNKLKCDNSLF